MGAVRFESKQFCVCRPDQQAWPGSARSNNPATHKGTPADSNVQRFRSGLPQTRTRTLKTSRSAAATRRRLMHLEFSILLHTGATFPKRTRSHEMAIGVIFVLIVEQRQVYVLGLMGIGDVIHS